MLGMPPRAMLDAAHKTKKYFDKLPDGSYALRKAKDGKKYKAPAHRRLHDIIGRPTTNDLYLFLVFTPSGSLLFLSWFYFLPSFFLFVSFRSSRFE